VTDYPSDKFGDCTFSRFGSIIHSDKHIQTLYFQSVSNNHFLSK